MKSIAFIALTLAALPCISPGQSIATINEEVQVQLTLKKGESFPVASTTNGKITVLVGSERVEVPSSAIIVANKPVPKGTIFNVAVVEYIQDGALVSLLKEQKHTYPPRPGSSLGSVGGDGGQSAPIETYTTLEDTGEVAFISGLTGIDGDRFLVQAAETGVFAYNDIRGVAHRVKKFILQKDKKLP